MSDPQRARFLGYEIQHIFASAKGVAYVTFACVRASKVDLTVNLPRIPGVLELWLVKLRGYIFVIAAKVGNEVSSAKPMVYDRNLRRYHGWLRDFRPWIPAFAGMTCGRKRKLRPERNSV